MSPAQPVPTLPVQPPVTTLAGHWPVLSGARIRELASARRPHWRVTTPAGAFELWHSSLLQEPAELAARVLLGALLRQRGVPCPRTVAAAGGREFVLVDGRMWTLTESVTGAAFDDDSPDQLAAVAGTLAAYHRAVADVPVAYAEPDVLQQLRSRADALRPDRFWLGQVSDVLATMQPLSPLLPRLVMHGAAHRGSFLFRGDEVVCLFDIDSARPGPRVQDVAVALTDLVSPPPRSGSASRRPLDVFRAAGYLRAYAAVSPLTAAEQRALPVLVRARLLLEVLDALQRLRAGAGDEAAVLRAGAQVLWLANHHPDLARVVKVCGHG